MKRGVGEGGVKTRRQSFVADVRGLQQLNLNWTKNSNSKIKKKLYGSYILYFMF